MQQVRVFPNPFFGFHLTVDTLAVQLYSSFWTERILVGSSDGAIFPSTVL